MISEPLGGLDFTDYSDCTKCRDSADCGFLLSTKNYARIKVPIRGLPADFCFSAPLRVAQTSQIAFSRMIVDPHGERPGNGRKCL